MAFNWSDPYQGQGTNTAAQIQAGFRPETVSIAPIVAAIMQQRARAQQQQEQQTQDLVKGINSLSAGYGQYQAQGSANDVANAAIYGSQYPNDTYGGYMDPNRVPDYGGSDALKSALIQKKLEEDPLKQQLEQARINSANALANSRWSNPGGRAGSTGQPTTNQQWEEMNRQLKRQKELLTNELGDVPIGQAANDNAYSTVTDFGGPSDLTRIGPARFTSYKDATGNQKQMPDYSNMYPGADASRLEAAAQAYQNALKQGQQGRQPGVGYGEDGRPIEGATSSDTTSTRPGAGPSVAQSDVNQAAGTMVGKPLDRDTARQFLEAAHGDKDMARKLARDAGYTF